MGWGPPFQRTARPCPPAVTPARPFVSMVSRRPGGSTSLM
ncbi:hypothetical protein [Azospirillum doebereinerae]